MMLTMLWLAFAAFTTVTSSPLAERKEDENANAGAVGGTSVDASANADLDNTVLQFALTLEHLENVFYKQALQKFTEADFTAAGFDQGYFTNLQFIAQDEETHVVVLTQQLLATGQQPVEACEYDFGTALDDVNSFVSLGSVLEGVGVSAYLGGAAIVTNKDILTAAAAILVAEGLHQGIQRSGLQLPPSANIVGTPASPNSVFTLASAFIVSCPPTNLELPFTAFPKLTADQQEPIAKGSTVTFTIEAGEVPEPFFMTFVSGIDTISVPGTNDNGALSAEVPAKSSGQTYAFVTDSEAAGAIQDSQVLFGPAILEVIPDAPTVDFTIQ